MLLLSHRAGFLHDANNNFQEYSLVYQHFCKACAKRTPIEDTKFSQDGRLMEF